MPVFKISHRNPSTAETAHHVCSLETISQTSQSEVAAVGRSPIGRDRVALGCLWILQGPALEEEAWEAREGLDELPARASTEGAG
jgi:hypothetical protein